MLADSDFKGNGGFHLLQATIDSLSAHIAILKNDGTIEAVNRAWKLFSDNNSGRQSDYGIGLNYIKMSAPDGYSDETLRNARGDLYYSIMAARSIAQVATGEKERAQITYPCHAPHEQRWFMMTVTPLELNGERYIVTSHENVTLLKQKEESISAALKGTVRALSDMSEIRDPYTAGHQNNVAVLSAELARIMQLTEEQQLATELAASIHDIGKIAVPAEILTRPGRLNELEYKMIREHSRVGHDIIAAVPFPWPLAAIILQHHERIDGGGYPDGLKGDDIRIEAQIIMVADVLDAMISHRPYRPGLGAGAAFDELNKNSGKLYNSEIVKACFQADFSTKLKELYPYIKLPAE